MNIKKTIAHQKLSLALHVVREGLSRQFLAEEMRGALAVATAAADELRELDKQEDSAKVELPAQ